MDEKEMVKAKEELKAKVIAIAQSAVANPGLELAKLANDNYDAELPIPEVIGAVFETASVEPGEDYDYFVIEPEAKVVYTVSSGSVTQTNVSVDAENELSFSSYDSAEDYVYLDDILDGKYDPIAMKAKAQQEVLNRLEIKAVCDLLIAGAVAKSNTFAWTSGDKRLTFAKLVAMIRSVALYGTNLVLIAGANVMTDIMLMDYYENKNREFTVEKAKVKVYPIEAFQYTHSGTIDVLDADKAILVAVSDSAGNKPGHFVRRKVNAVAMGEGVTAKERLVISSGPAKHVGSARKLAIGILTYERFGAVLTNSYTVAVFKNDSTYA